MKSISCGRTPKTAKKTKKCKKKRMFGYADICALILALLCAGCIISWSAKDCPNDAVTAAITYTPPEKQQPKGFWDYFSEAMAKAMTSVLGLDS